MKLVWYFDFISPFAYLQLARFAQLPADISVEYRPILLAGLLNYWQNVGPAEIPPKRIFTYQHCYWLAKQSAVPFKMPPAHPFNSLSALRLAIALGSRPDAVQTIFDAIWKYGLALDSKEAITFLEEALALENLDELINDPQVKHQLRENTERAAADGVFGVPSFVTVENTPQMFWGLDAFEMMLDYLNNPLAFRDTEMQRLDSLPVGIQRHRE